MKELLSRLLAITNFSKTIHYNCKGENAYSDHLLADKIGDGLDTFRDDINEICFLGEGLDTPLSSEVLTSAISFLPEETQDINSLFRSLDDLLVNTLEHIQSLIDNQDDENKISFGEENLLGGIAQDLQLKHGLLVLRLK